jgi:hypothetical protein
MAGFAQDGWVLGWVRFARQGWGLGENDPTVCPRRLGAGRGCEDWAKVALVRWGRCGVPPIGVGTGRSPPDWKGDGAGLAQHGKVRAGVRPTGIGTGRASPTRGGNGARLAQHGRMRAGLARQGWDKGGVDTGGEGAGFARQGWGHGGFA